MVKTIVLIHGYGFDNHIWHPVSEAFEGFRVIYLSLPGFGDNKVIDSYSIASLAQSFWKTLDVPREQPVHLVGHSMGGYVCMEMLAQEPYRVASLALVHSHVFADSDEKKAQRTTTAEQIMEFGRESVVKRMIPSLFAEGYNHPEVVAELVATGMKYDDNAWRLGALAMRDRADHTETLKNSQIPVLMIGGEKDTAVPPDLIFKQASLPERNQVKIYPGVGHMAMYEARDLLIRDLSDFHRQ
jgi:pimeloyl-ACP methyl ester carboxylesterase